MYSATLFVWRPSASETVAIGGGVGPLGARAVRVDQDRAGDAGPGLPRAAPSVRMISRRGSRAAQTERSTMARETSRIARVMLMSRGQASTQLKMVRQRQTPSLSARISSRSSAASSRLSKMKRWALTIAAGPT